MTDNSTRIILVGMYGSGKTSIASEIAHLTGRYHIDMDLLIKGYTGHDVHSYIETYGVHKFRELEFNLMKEISIQGERFSVISTDGLMITNNRLRNFLVRNKNNFIVWIKTDTKFISVPKWISDSKDTLKHKQYDLYTECADYVQYNNRNKDMTEVAKSIIAKSKEYIASPVDFYTNNTKELKRKG